MPIIINLFILILLISCKKIDPEFIRYDDRSGYNEYQRKYHLDSTFTEIYIVKNYRDDARTESKIDNLVCERIQFLKDSIHLLKFEFYKYSKKTNLIYLKKHPNYFDEIQLFESGSSVSKDYLWEYRINTRQNETKKWHEESSRMNQNVHKLYFQDPECFKNLNMNR